MKSSMLQIRINKHKETTDKITPEKPSMRELLFSVIFNNLLCIELRKKKIPNANRIDKNMYIEENLL